MTLKKYFNRLSDVQHGRTCIVCIKNYIFKNEVGIQAIKSSETSDEQW